MTDKEKAPEWLLTNIESASRMASRVYLVLLGVLVYVAITVVSTTDLQLVLNKPAKLPVVDIEVNIVGFFLLSPIIATLVFVYLQLYLHRIKGLTAQLREDYAPVEKRRLYPWMLNIAEEPEPGAVGNLQRGDHGLGIALMHALAQAQRGLGKGLSLRLLYLRIWER